VRGAWDARKWVGMVAGRRGRGSWGVSSVIGLGIYGD